MHVLDGLGAYYGVKADTVGVDGGGQGLPGGAGAHGADSTGGGVSVKALAAAFKLGSTAS